MMSLHDQESPQEIKYIYNQILYHQFHKNKLINHHIHDVGLLYMYIYHFLNHLNPV